MDRWIYLPIDVKARELHGKALLTAAAVRRGYKVVIGRKREVHKSMKFLPPGFYLGLGAQENFSEEYADLRAKNFIISAMDEEGLITFDDDIYKSLRVSSSTLSHMNIFFTWGNYQTRLLNAIRPAPECSIEPVGNLRFDTLAPKFRSIWGNDITNLKKEYGRYVLIVSSFGSANHFDGGEKFLQSMKDKKIIRTFNDELVYKKYIDLKKKNLDLYLDAIPHLAAKHPDITFIVRPHPSEGHELWLKKLVDMPNVKVVSENSIQPWIMGSEFIIHHFCTTAVEALLADVPAIAYRPYVDSSIESQLPYNCSLEVFTLDELLAACSNLLRGDTNLLNTKRKSYAEYYKAYIASGQDGHAYERMLDVYDGVPVQDLGLLEQVKLKVHGLVDIFRKQTAGTSYLNHKFPEMDRAEFITIFENVAPLVGLKGFSVKKVKNNCFVVTNE